MASMSRKSNCYDNAAMEAFWSTRKREALEGSEQWTKDRVGPELFEFIEATYNRSRLHSSLMGDTFSAVPSRLKASWTSAPNLERLGYCRFIPPG